MEPKLILFEPHRAGGGACCPNGLRFAKSSFLKFIDITNAEQWATQPFAFLDVVYYDNPQLSVPNEHDESTEKSEKKMGNPVS